jgi:hypothetical protein
MPEEEQRKVVEKMSEWTPTPSDVAAVGGIPLTELLRRFRQDMIRGHRIGQFKAEAAALNVHLR